MPDTMTPTKIADDAIALFLEYRDQHGYDEDEAHAKAVSEVADAESLGMLNPNNDDEDRREVVPGWTIEELLSREG